MTRSPRPLTFAEVDGVGFAAAKGRFQSATLQERYAPQRLGPLLELLHLPIDQPAAVTALSIAENSAAARMVYALRQNRDEWVGSDRHRMGFIRALDRKPNGHDRVTAFLMDAQRAARDVGGFPGSVPRWLVAAMGELEGNIREHSEAVPTGVLAFRAAPGVFEFVVADQGIGVLRSLRGGTEYRDLTDHGRALSAALTEGVSRFGVGVGRGLGFRPLFIGLLNLRGYLRFRSGDHALIMDGTSPSLARARISQKPSLNGFFVSVCCRRRSGPTD
jgi:hypothetical protein